MSTTRRPFLEVRAILLLTLLAIGVSPAGAGELQQPASEQVLSQSMRCPEPPSVSVMSLELNGAAKIVVMRGMDARTARTLTNYKQLTRADMDDLIGLLRGSGFDRLPETPEKPGRPSLAKHSCMITLEIRLYGKAATLRYDSDPDTSSPVKEIARKIHGIVERHEWKESVP